MCDKRYNVKNTEISKYSLMKVRTKKIVKDAKTETDRKRNKCRSLYPGIHKYKSSSVNTPGIVNRNIGISKTKKINECKQERNKTTGTNEYNIRKVGNSEKNKYDIKYENNLSLEKCKKESVSTSYINNRSTVQVTSLQPGNLSTGNLLEPVTSETEHRENTVRLLNNKKYLEICDKIQCDRGNMNFENESEVYGRRNRKTAILDSKNSSEDHSQQISIDILHFWTLLFYRFYMTALRGYRSSSFRNIFAVELLYLFMLSSSQAFELRPTTMLSKQAVVGHSVHLPCELPRLPDNPSLILWYKNQNSKPFYSFDTREMVAGQHKVHDQIELGRRANFSFSTVPYATKIVLGHLMINNITLEDAGNFTCRVDFQKAQTAMSLLQLEVLEPIWRITVVDAREREIGKETSPYEESERLYLICRAYGGQPAPVVEWLAGNHIIASSSPYGMPSSENLPLPLWGSGDISRSIKEVEVILQLPQLKREDQGRTFTCRANNSNLTPVRTKTITITMSLRPVSVEIEGPSGPLWSGKESQFQCRSWGSKPPAKLKWGPESLLKTLNFQTSLDKNTTLSRAQLIPSPDDDGRSINCTAVNPVVPHYTMSTAKKLVVHYAPQVEAKLASFLPTNIKEGDDVYFECQVKANPPPRSLVWLHEGNVVEENRERGILVQGHNLVLQTVSRTSRGKFQCKATNAVATVTSEPVVLDVMFIPECKEPRNVTVSVSPDEEIRLNCTVEAYPKPDEFIWRLNGSNGWENIDADKIEVEGLSSTFSYSASAKRQTISMFASPNFQDKSMYNSLDMQDKPMFTNRILRDNLETQQNSITRSNVISSESSPVAEPVALGSLHYHNGRPNSKLYSYNTDYSVHAFTASGGRLRSVRHFPSGESYGVVYCIARNSVGRQKEPCIFNISPAGPPGDLVSCSLVNQSATTLRVSCVPGHDGGLQQSFTARVLDEDSRRVVFNVSSPTPEFYISGLAPGRDYLVIVMAVNPKGISKPYVLEGFALKVAENKINEHSSPQASPLLGLFVGVITGFVLVLSVLILVTRARCRRRLANSERVPAKQLSGGDEDPLSPSSNPSLDGAPNDANEDGSDEHDACLQAPDLTAQTPDSLASITTHGSEGYERTATPSIEGRVKSRQFRCISSSTPPPLLGLSNTYGGGAGVPRTNSTHGFSVSRDTPATQSSSTMTRHPTTSDIQQPLHSVDLSRVTSNANRYYTLKINCTRQSNESFV